MYIGFETKKLELDRVEALYPPTIILSETIPETTYYLVIEEYSQYFYFNEKGEFKTKMWEGWNNYPLYTFNRDKYEAGEDPFEPFDPYSSKTFKHRIRRERIENQIKWQLRYPIEIKKLRKALKRVIMLLEASGANINWPELKEFMEYSNTIETVISKHPKVSKYLNRIDLKTENGVNNDA